MKEKNTVLFNKIKDARTIEEKVYLAAEYFQNTSEHMYNDEYFSLNVDETKEILDIIGEKYDDQTKTPINSEYLENLCHLIQEASNYNDSYWYGKVPIKLKNIEYKISSKLLSIFEAIKEYKYNVYLKSAFKEINHEFELSYVEYIDDFDDSNLCDAFPYTASGFDEYNLRPGDEGYEFSISEALDNMYGK